MAWGYRASSYANNGAGIGSLGDGNSTTVTLGAALTTADLIILHIVALNTASTHAAPTFTVSDSVNGTWGSAEVSTVTVDVVGLHGRMSVWAFPNSASGTPIVTVTMHEANGAIINCGLEVTAFSGIATSAATDTTKAASGTGANPSSGAVSPATGAASELMIGCYGDFGENTTLSVGNINAVAATLAGKHDVDGGRWQGLFEYADSGSSSGTPTATTTGVANTGWGLIAVVFKITGGGGVTGDATASAIAAVTISGGSYQLALPVSDVSDGAWTTETGATTNLYASVGEPTPYDYTFIQSENSPVNSQVTLRLGPQPVQPDAGNITLSIRHANNATYSIMQYSYELMQGASIIQSFGPYSVSTTTIAEVDLLVTNSITDWLTPFDVRITANQSA